MLSFIVVVGGLIFLGAPGAVPYRLLLSVTLTLLQIWRGRPADHIEAPP
jgi:hypothetical protein